MSDEEIVAALREAMESSARGNTYAQWAAHILPTVHRIAAAQAAEERPVTEPYVTRNAKALSALALIARGCETTTGPLTCRTPGSGRTRGAQYGADAWCDPCIAADALDPHRYDPETCRCTCGALDHPEWGVTA